MKAEAKTAAVERDLMAFPEALAAELRRDLDVLATDMMVRAHADLRATTTQRTGRASASIKGRASVSKTRATVRVTFAQDFPFYAAWLNFGLAPRPWRERAVSRKGYLSTRIGKAKVHKAWGIRARGFADMTRTASIPKFVATVQGSIDRSATEFSRGTS